MIYYLVIVLILIIAYVIRQYNTIVRMSKAINQAKSAIDVYLTQRFDLIPNLIECVKGYMEYEKETFVKITEMRTQYLNTKDLKEGANLNNECNKILLNAEQYPELKASEHFLNLQKNLSRMEDQLQAARRIYNVEVTQYNTKINVIPTNIIAKYIGAQEAELFKAEDEAQDNVNVQL